MNIFKQGNKKKKKQEDENFFINQLKTTLFLNKKMSKEVLLFLL